MNVHEAMKSRISRWEGSFCAEFSYIKTQSVVSDLPDGIILQEYEHIFRDGILFIPRLYPSLLEGTGPKLIMVSRINKIPNFSDFLAYC